MAKDRYEISLWEDYLVPAADGVPEHYEERKIAVIGTEQMTLACRAIEPNLVENINGTNTFTFKMIYKCSNDNLDEIKYQLLAQLSERGSESIGGAVIGEAVVGTSAISFDVEQLRVTEPYGIDEQYYQLILGKLFFKDGMYNNPFIDFLVNERKVKVLWKDKWYDFVIKNCQKDSNNRTLTCTCKDLFINELSKNGYSLEFDTKLENNQGTVLQLAEKVLEGTDWQVDEDNSDIIQQETEEPVYEVTTTSGFSATNETEGGTISIPTNSKILVFYSSISTIIDEIDSDKSTGYQYVQFLYDSNYKRDTNSQLVLNGTCCALDNPKWEVEDIGFGAKAIKIYVDTTNYFTVYYQAGVSSSYRAKRLVRSAQCILDPLTEKYVNIYKATRAQEGICDVNDEIYGYRDTLFTDPISVNNLVVNSTEFKDLSGWYSNLTIPLVLHPKFTDNTDILTYNAKSYLRFSGGSKYVNSGITELNSYISDGFQKGEKYIFRAKVKKGDGNELINIVDEIKSYSNRVEILTSEIEELEYEYENTIWDTWNEDYKIALQGYISKLETLLNQYEENGYSDYLEIDSENVNDLFSQEEIAISGYYNTNVLNPSIRGYQLESGDITFKTTQYFQFTEIGFTKDGWFEYEAECIESITRASILAKKVGLCFEPSVRNDNLLYWIEDVQFFKYAEGLEGEGEDVHTVRINPGELNTQSVAAIRYNYYNHTANEDLTSVDDLSYIYRSTIDWVDPPFELTYNENFSKIRSITISKSNRFNILQTLAETFECWLEPRIEHNADGSFIYEGGVPKKYISFKKERGIETGLVFEYGIDLKTIQKTTQSDQIVTKTIVSPNNNQYAPNGFCTISRSTENYPRVNFILNFDYFINQGLIDGAALYRDLYLAAANQETEESYIDSIGYYYWLHKYNLQYDENIETLSAKKTERDKQQSWYTTYNAYIDKTKEEIDNIKTRLANLAGEDDWENPNVAEYLAKNSEIVEVKKEVVSLTSLENSLVEYINIKDSIYKEEEVEEDSEVKIVKSGILAELNKYIEDVENKQEELNEKIKALDERFYKKYSYFIQEGTWIDEKYVDENLYYLDAQSVAYTSAFPQATYNVSVLRLTALEAFKNKIFNVGDIAFIQDTDFFGYVFINGTKTPYKEKVLIAEVSSFFDEPDKDTFKIQNYKTQFDDLFSRISSATQSLKYNEGSYAKAASIINTDGTISVETLQQSLNKATNLVLSSINDAIVEDNTGLSVVDITNRNRITKLTSGGLFVSSDGGTTWRGAVSAEGIATDQLTSGNINTSSINILDGEFPSFRWDSKGISAFEINNLGVNFSKYVRFDHFGVYGITNLENFAPETEDEVWNTAKFGLTWKGFFLKSDYTNGYVSISSDNDFQVMQIINNYREDVWNEIEDSYEEVIGSKAIERIKIGAIKFENGIPTKYGITIRNVAEEIVFETGDDGNIKITGEIEATSGHIGGMVATSDSLSMDRIYITPGLGIYANYPDRSFYGIVDESVAGRAIAVDVEVVDDEVVYDVPTHSEPLFLISDEDGSALFNNITARGHIEARTGTLGDLDVIGILTVGDVNGESIKINGSYDTVTGIHNASIYSSSYETSNFTDGWKIGYDGHAIFNNITARGAIKTAVFEYGEIQAVGGIYLFRPSSTIRSAEADGNDLIVKLESPYLFTRNDYCKVSNYVSGGGSADPNVENILSNNGLSYVYKVDLKETYIGEDENFRGYVGNSDDDEENGAKVDTDTIAGEEDVKREIKLVGAAELVQGENAIATVENLEGAALINMGRTQDSLNYCNGRFNYGIGVNSSDNTVNLPARAISLFETIIDPSSSIKVLYNFKAILGTLPELGGLVDNNIYKNLVDTQGIFTNNMYIGDANNYLAFYTDKDDNDIAKLTIKATVYAIGGQIGGWKITENTLSADREHPDGEGVDVDYIKLSSIGNSLTIGENFKVTDTGALVIGQYLFDDDSGLVYEDSTKKIIFSSEGLSIEQNGLIIFSASESFVRIGRNSLDSPSYLETYKDDYLDYSIIEGEGTLNLKAKSIILGTEDLSQSLKNIIETIEELDSDLEKVKNNFKVRGELTFVDPSNNSKWCTILRDNNLDDVWIGEGEE